MTISKNVYGYWVISDMVGGYRIERKYIGYTKKEAIRLFKNEIKRTTKLVDQCRSRI